MSEPATKRQRTGEYGKITLRQCTKVLKVIKQLPQAAPFLAAVDYVMLRIPDYPDIVKHPMDLGTIDKKLIDGKCASPRAPGRTASKRGRRPPRASARAAPRRLASPSLCPQLPRRPHRRPPCRSGRRYDDVDSFVADVRVVFNNSYLYNKRESPVGLATKTIEDTFEEKLGELVNQSVNSAVSAATGVAKPPALAPIRTGGGVEFAYVSTIRPLIKSLVSHALSGPFRAAFDWEKAGMTTYPSIVKTPMDLGTVTKKLEEGSYKNVAQIRVDLELIWENCIAFNGRQTWIGDHGSQLRDFCKKKFSQAGLQDEQPLSYESGTPRKTPGGGAKFPPPAAAPAQPARRPPTKRYRAGQEPAGASGAGAAEPKPEPAALAPSVVSAAPATDAIILTMRQCNALLKPIREMAEARDFLQPVDWQRYQLNDYPTVIPRPMDLGTIQKKLDMRQYESSQAFVEDVRLVWANAIKYNGAQSPYGQKATTMRDKFDAALHAALNPPASGQRPPPALPPGGLPGGPPPAPPGVVTASSADGRPPIAPMLASPVVATARPSFGGGGGSGFAAGSSSGAFGGGGAVGGASTGGGSAREQLRYTYRRVIQAARQHQVGTLFKQPVPWEKLGLTNYPDIVKQPMDLQTIGKKLENCEYGAFDELKADIDLMFSNAALFNEASPNAALFKKQIDSCRTFLDKKMAAAAQVTQKQRAAAFH